MRSATYGGTDLGSLDDVDWVRVALGAVSVQAKSFSLLDASLKVVVCAFNANTSGSVANLSGFGTI